MITLVYIRLNYNNSIELYHTDKIFDFANNRFFIVQTKHGMEIGEAIGKSLALPSPIISPEDESIIIRSTNWEDFEIQEENRRKVPLTFEIAKEKIQKRNLPIKLISIHHFYEGNKILFNFSADGRVDFRELVKDLAATFKVRIELRQIGVRDESMILGGYGVCGLELCCSTQHTNTESISIKMAKEQNLTLNSMKISGICGRLMCCLQYEFNMYREIKKDFPAIGSPININGKNILVSEINIQSRIITLTAEDGRVFNVPLDLYNSSPIIDDVVAISIDNK